MSDKPAAALRPHRDRRAHRVEISDGALRREIRWYVDDELVATTKSADEKVTLKPEDPELGLLALRFSMLGHPRRATLVRAGRGGGREGGGRASAASTSTPSPGRAPRRTSRRCGSTRAGTPRSRPPAAWPRWSCRCCSCLPAAAVHVLAAAARREPAEHPPARPARPAVDPVAGHQPARTGRCRAGCARCWRRSKYVWPVVLAFVLARAEIRRRRKQDELKAGLRQAGRAGRRVGLTDAVEVQPGRLVVRRHHLDRRRHADRAARAARPAPA